jgi:hypothetical protein
MKPAELSKQLKGVMAQRRQERKSAQIATAAAEGQRDSLGRREACEAHKEMFVPIYGDQIRSNAYTDPKLSAAYVAAFEGAQA